MKTLFCVLAIVCCGCRAKEPVTTPKPPPVDAAGLMAEVTGAIQGESALVFPTVVIAAPVVKPRRQAAAARFLDFDTAKCVETPSDSRAGAKVIRCSR